MLYHKNGHILLPYPDLSSRFDCACTNDFRKNLWNPSLKKTSFPDQTASRASNVSAEMEHGGLGFVFVLTVNVFCNLLHCSHLSTTSWYKIDASFTKFHFLQPFKILITYFYKQLSWTHPKVSFRWTSFKTDFMLARKV